ncbi:hypothetical protein AVEN_10994-1 [Araneus ventricosus]|uniref:Uncharacterized protein n=1 Tax=Araneus ventricosus TaxID=182803 RepID=A0A4Y2X0C8_ARAVE|nr:hypothetical protein AVEN_10994-1 [Araneus ventricosus]
MKLAAAVQSELARSLQKKDTFWHSLRIGAPAPACVGKRFLLPASAKALTPALRSSPPYLLNVAKGLKSEELLRWLLLEVQGQSG